MAEDTLKSDVLNIHIASGRFERWRPPTISAELEFRSEWQHHRSGVDQKDKTNSERQI